MERIGEIIIILGLVFMLLGIIGICKYRDFYPRILIASKIDTVGVLTVMLGIIIRQGFSFFSFRVLILLSFLLLISPMLTHLLARSAYLSGHGKDDEHENSSDDGGQS